MMRKQEGFSLVELMVSMAIFIFVITAATGIFIPLVNQFKQQSKIAEANIAGIVGLELLRTDLEQAGFGLPWYFPNDTINYNEAAAAPASVYNDAPGNVPRAIASGINNSPGIVTGSNYLVVRSAVVTGSDTAQKWTYILNESEPNPRQWGPLNNVSNDLTTNTDRVVVIRPRVSDTRLRELVMNGTQFFTTYSQTSFPANFSPTKQSEAYLIYGIDPANNLKMPFNRADYYVSTANVPTTCASGTGVLVKAILDHQTGINFPQKNIIPLLDCVADMQVIFGLDMNSDGIIGTYSNADGSTVMGATAITKQNEGAGTSNVQQVLQSHLDLSDYRSSLQEVRVYILAHEGQKDPSYTYPNNSIFVGDYNNLPSLGRTFNFADRGIIDGTHYRWKLYTLVVKLRNMR
jgi:prepilin-type N-terminal cleavage/methylation domain-containing protein